MPLAPIQLAACLLPESCIRQIDPVMSLCRHIDVEVEYKGASVNVMSLCGASPDGILTRPGGSVEACLEVKARSFFKVACDRDGGVHRHVGT